MKAMIVPGNGNAGMSQCWYPYAKQGLEKLGMEVVAENMPDPGLARRRYWLPFIEKRVGNYENSVLIGHSSGVVAILRYLEERKALGAVLVGAYHTDLGDEKEKVSGYFDGPWQWEKIRGNARWFIQFASTDDPWIPIEEARYVKGQLHAEYHEFENRGHFMENTFPELVEAVRGKLKGK